MDFDDHLLILMMMIAIYQDYRLTGLQPDPIFYIFVPPVSMIGSALIGYGLARLFKNPIAFGSILFIVLVSDFIGQIYENLSKLIYYLVWEYPGWLYFLALLPLVILVPGYLFVRWLKTSWWLALILALALFIGGMIFAIAFTSLTGIDTPGY